MHFEELAQNIFFSQILNQSYNCLCIYFPNPSKIVDQATPFHRFNRDLSHPSFMFRPLMWKKRHQKILKSSLQNINLQIVGAQFTSQNLFQNSTYI